MAIIRPATGDDVLHVSGAMRQADQDELEAGGSSPVRALIDGLMYSAEPIAGCYEDDRPVAMAGVVPDPNDLMAGHIWMLGTDEMATRPVEFCRASTPVILRWNEKFPVLTNQVDERNTLHIRWLKWLGFVFLSREPCGPQQLPFLQFVRISSCGVQRRGRPSIPKNAER